MQAQEEAIAWSDVMMIEYSATNQDNASVIRNAEEQDITILFKKVLDSGHLSASEAIHFITKKSPWNAKHCAVIGSTRVDRMTQNAHAFSALEL